MCGSGRCVGKIEIDAVAGGVVAGEVHDRLAAATEPIAKARERRPRTDAEPRQVAVEAGNLRHYFAPGAQLFVAKAQLSR